MTSLFSTTKNAALAAASIFALKHVALSLLQVRERFQVDLWASPEDARNYVGAVFGPIFKVGPSLGGPAFIQRAQRVLTNNSENEPVFLGLVLAAIATGTAPAETATVTAVFVGGRLVHNVAYIFGETINAGFRSTSYLAGLFGSAYLAARVVSSLL
jgi:uncharacterized MAPEG superfamily protein